MVFNSHRKASREENLVFSFINGNHFSNLSCTFFLMINQHHCILVGIFGSHHHLPSRVITIIFDDYEIVINDESSNQVKKKTERERREKGKMVS